MQLAFSLAQGEGENSPLGKDSTTHYEYDV